jgi:hypothetical protein
MVTKWYRDQNITKATSLQIFRDNIKLLLTTRSGGR